MRTSKGEQSLFSDFERRDGLLASYRRKILKEFIERISRLEVIDEILHRDSSTRENGSAALNFGI